MISFIVIGKNEGERILQCIQSIEAVVKEDGICDYEIIYVDSKSTDGSVEKLQEKTNLSIFIITGYCNAAIARNIGANEAKGDILYFIDGDMKLLPGAIKIFLTSENKLIHPFCTGLFDNYIHDSEWRFIRKSPGNYNSSTMNKDTYQPITGGLFIIEKKLWNKIGGMDTRFNRSQDIDFGLNISKKGILLMKKGVIIVEHFMIYYLDESRFKSFAKNNTTYYRGLLFRRNILNRFYYKYALRNDYSSFGLLLFIILSLSITPFFILIYFLLITIRVINLKRKKKNSISFFTLIFSNLNRDISFFLSLLFFYPSYRKEVYKKINI